MKDSIFDVMHSWVFDVENELILEFFFKEIENYMDIHHQKKNVKKKLLTIKMNKTKSVSEYYHRLFKLWQRAEISLEDRIDMFIESVSLDISNALQAREYKDFTKLLKDARRVEGYRKDAGHAGGRDTEEMMQSASMRIEETKCDWTGQLQRLSVWARSSLTYHWTRKKSNPWSKSRSRIIRKWFDSKSQSLSIISK